MTEKNYNPNRIKATKKQKAIKQEARVEAPAKLEEKKEVKKLEEIEAVEETDGEEKNEKDQAKKTKKPEQKKETKKVKKDEVCVNARDIPISTKQSVAVCKFVKNKKIEDAINDLERVVLLKKAVPMKGELPHRKGKRMMSGRFPKKAAQCFIRILKSLSANAINHELDEPIITEAVANFASRPYGRFGRVQRKRTHIKISARSKKIIKKNRGVVD